MFAFFARQLFRSSGVKVNIYNKVLFNELPEVPLVSALRPSPLRRIGRRQRTCLVHSVAVSVEQQASPLSSSGLSEFESVKSYSTMATGKKPFERLPTAVRPKHYVLRLKPDMKALVFDGDVAVQIEVVKQVNEIVLNAIDLEIKDVSLKGTDSLRKPKSTNFSIPDETVTFSFDSPILPGPYSLHMTFKGEINDKMKGLYRSMYENHQGEERYAAVTQFEPTDARRCFPCFDEPALKATFDISLRVPKGLVALSNMPVKKSQPEGDMVWYEFETTPIMSTYLVACVVGEYDYVEDKSSDGVLVRVYTPRGKKEQGRFALEVCTKVLPYYKDYFNIAYPLPKIDLIAIADFSAGAMENWGLITYRETCLLVDPQNTAAAQKQWIALVVGHELAHQWFGNLVTMEWWTHLWLNEGYASFVEFLCVDHLFPQFDIWTQFVNESYFRALELDSLNSSHPIEVPVGHPSEIDEIFDDISYSKGASVIRMLHNYIGDEDFRKGMNLYLTRHQYKNTFTEDLWAALEEASKKPVGAVMSTWTKQMGFPVIKVTSRSDSQGVVLTLSQSKYTADGSKASESFLWMIPISITCSSYGGKIINTVLTTREAEVVLPNAGPQDWIKVNPGTVGFYRTQYPTELLEKFIPAIKDRSLPPLDRLGLLGDLFAMVEAGHTSTVEVLKLLEAYEDETDYTVWSCINNVLSKLSMLLTYTDCGDSFNTYQKNLLNKVGKRLGWESKSEETHLETLLRSLVLGKMSWLDDVSHIEEAQKRFDAHVKSSQILPADLRAACYKTVLRAGGEDTYNTLLNMYRQVDLHEEKDRISRSLGAAKDTEILKKVIDFAISDEVRAQDTVFVLMSVAMTRVGRDMVWKYFVDNWSLFSERYKGNLLTRFVKFVAENFASEESAKEVEEFFKTHEFPGIDRTVHQAVEQIRLNAAWLERDTDAIRKYLNSN